MIMIIMVIMIRDAWVVLVVVAVSQSIPGTWGAMMVVVLQVIIIIIISTQASSSESLSFLTILMMIVSVESKSLIPGWPYNHESIDYIEYVSNIITNSDIMIITRPSTWTAKA